MRARRDGQTGPRPIKAIVQPGLTQTIYKLLRDKIANHDYAPGERLQLDPLAIQLGVSRTPVRDALNQLAVEGLVEIRPRRGTFVAQVDRATVAELYQLRLMIDTSVGKLLAPRAMRADRWPSTTRSGRHWPRALHTRPPKRWQRTSRARWASSGRSPTQPTTRS